MVQLGGSLIIAEHADSVANTAPTAVIIAASEAPTHVTFFCKRALAWR